MGGFESGTGEIPPGGDKPFGFNIRGVGNKASPWWIAVNA